MSLFQGNTTLLEKYLTCFYENLMDFNETRLHDATLHLHMHAWFFPSLSIASIDGKQYLNEVVFSALVGFSLYPYTQDSQNMLDSTNSDPDFMNTIITGDESWVYGYDHEPVGFLEMKIRREL